MKKYYFCGVGLGPGDPGLVTLKALEVLKSVDVIFVPSSKNSANCIAKSIIDSLPGVKAEVIQLSFAMTSDMAERERFYSNNVDEIKNALFLGKSCAFALIGDPLTYGTYGYIIKALANISEIEIETIPGVNSWSSLAAKNNFILVENKEELRIVPSFEFEADQIALDNGTQETIVYLKAFKEKNNILDSLDSNSEVIYGANIGLENEFISSDREAIREAKPTYLSMIIERKNVKKT